ncbi:unnamed protein product, partial [Nesidiocoris tenuis]
MPSRIKNGYLIVSIREYSENKVEFLDHRIIQGGDALGIKQTIICRREPFSDRKETERMTTLSSPFLRYIGTCRSQMEREREKEQTDVIGTVGGQKRDRTRNGRRYDEFRG